MVGEESVDGRGGVSGWWGRSQSMVVERSVKRGLLTAIVDTL